MSRGEVMNVRLKCVTRENWEEALSLKVKEQQITFVPSVAVSLAKVYIKPDGDNIVYVPFAIYDKRANGRLYHACLRCKYDEYVLDKRIHD